MHVVSLFDGIRTGMFSMIQSGFKVDRYDSFEIDRYARQVANHHFPMAIEHGDVVEANFSSFKGADLVIGGFPCTDLSTAKKDRKGLKGNASGLFWELVDAIETINPKYFLVENVDRMPKKDQNIISRMLGVEPIKINAALVSAQNRVRLYWTNIPNVTQPKDEDILLMDIIETDGFVDRDKSNCVTSGFAKKTVKDYVSKAKGQVVFDAVGGAFRSRKHGDSTIKKLEVREDGKSNALTTCNTDNVVVKTICVNSKSGRGGKPNLQPSQQDRIYDINGKSPCVTRSYLPNVAIPLGGSSPTYTGDGIYQVVNGSIQVRDTPYPINLPDGFYSIRKLSPIECERLQSLPDNYTAGISNTQRYICLGNGWNSKVISHILSFMR